MKAIRSLALSLSLYLFLTPSASAESPETKHWYEITTSGVQQPTRFVGSSRLKPEEVAKKVAAGEVIVLENIRSVFAQPDKGIAMGWNPNSGVVKLYFPARSILYFANLPKDPAERPAEAEAGSKTGTDAEPHAGETQDAEEREVPAPGS